MVARAGPSLGQRSLLLQRHAKEIETLRSLQLDFRMKTPLGRGAESPVNELMRRMFANSVFALDVVDWILHNARVVLLDRRGPAAKIGQLDRLLMQGGSAWEVTPSGENTYQLSRRALGPVLDVLEQTGSEATRAHNHLIAAWTKLMGRNPDPSGAYRESVRAVEAVAKPVILPNDDRATMGSMIAALRDKPEKWTVTLGSVEGVRVQMEGVWKGQLDRHGTDDETVPLNVSQAEADAAFSSCLSLVRQFAGGHIARKS